MTAPLIALDDFAGTGWGVACHRLGIDERGVELMPEARATRAANGMRTVGADVWDHLAATAETPLAYDLLISSPPCQTFSMAGGGAGRRALDEVVGLIDSRAYLDVEALHAFGREHDPRTALVLTPLVRVSRDAPTYVVLEQVPPVLPVWERIAVKLRKWGYSVWVGVLNAEQYGVPQTRRRAVLIARADGVEAAPPVPTHSRYYSRDPKRIDPGVLPWVSMAEALGWGMTARPFVTAGNAVGRAEGIGGSGGKAAVQREKDGGRWLVRSSFGTPKTHHADGSPAGGHHTFDPEAAPAHTVTGIVSGWKIEPRGATMRSNYGTGGDPANRGERARDEPAATVTSKVDRNQWVAEPTTTGAQRVTIEEAAALQSYPPGFDWQSGPNGKPLTKTKAFLQIGNAVPPKLAEAILATLLTKDDNR